METLCMIKYMNASIYTENLGTQGKNFLLYKYDRSLIDIGKIQ